MAVMVLLSVSEYCLQIQFLYGNIFDLFLLQRARVEGIALFHSTFSFEVEKMTM
jgi:hypothetical protein